MYEPTVWKAGDTVTSAKLNKLEEGVTKNGLVTIAVIDTPIATDFPGGTSRGNTKSSDNYLAALITPAELQYNLENNINMRFLLHNNPEEGMWAYIICTFDGFIITEAGTKSNDSSYIYALNLRINGVSHPLASSSDDEYFEIVQQNA